MDFDLCGTARPGFHTRSHAPFRELSSPSFTGLFLDHEHKRDLDGDSCTVLRVLPVSKVVGCRKQEKCGERGLRRKVTQNRTKPRLTTATLELVIQAKETDFRFVVVLHLAPNAGEEASPLADWCQRAHAAPTPAGRTARLGRSLDDDATVHTLVQSKLCGVLRLTCLAFRHASTSMIPARQPLGPHQPLPKSTRPAVSGGQESGQPSWASG